MIGTCRDCGRSGYADGQRCISCQQVWAVYNQGLQNSQYLNGPYRSESQARLERQERHNTQALINLNKGMWK